MRMYVKYFNELFESNNFVKELEDAIADTKELINRGLLSNNDLEVEKKRIIAKYKDEMQQEFGSINEIDILDWANSIYGKTLTPELSNAINSQSYKNLIEKGFKIKLTKLEDLLDQKIIVYVENADAYIQLYKGSNPNSGIKFSRKYIDLNKKPTNPGIPFMDFMNYSFSSMFDYIVKSIDLNDDTLSDYTKSKNKIDNAKQYDKYLTELKSILSKFFNTEELIELVIERLRLEYVKQNPKQLFLNKEYVRINGVFNLSEYVKEVNSFANKGFVYLGIFDYDSFFNSELEDYFMENNIRWISSKTLYVGSVNTRNFELYYKALPLFEFPSYFTNIDMYCQLVLNKKYTSNMMVDLLDKQEKYYEHNKSFEIDKF